ncbi:MAG: curli assembly protein CsgF [bacterium]
MKKYFFIIFILINILLLTAISTNAENHTMSWNFRIFNNPNARQAAINIAEKQDSLVEEVQDPIEEFRESFERRLFYSIQRNLIDQIMDDEEPADGNYQTGNLDISISEDPDTGEVTLTITDLNTGESTVVTYSTNDYYYGG